VKKVLKWIGIVLGGLVGLSVLALVGLSILGGVCLNETQDIHPEAITIPTDEAALVRGEHLVNVACKSCHGEDLSGDLRGGFRLGWHQAVDVSRGAKEGYDNGLSKSTRVTGGDTLMKSLDRGGER
jgi:hypothetical protein